ncbi:hypothetical protein M231_03272 [Tremella mesenterica]|uniref:Uncharacterized protein n=1 Tax=Tremella mesenterica TaxID=5217 RepID=A0A4Q1BNJ0_TREME|nr:hypothetical protein M231_03272 [Tremella mesenterica]
MEALKPILNPPPPPPVDLIQSALFLPLSSVSLKQKGKKIRMLAQILAFDPSTALCILTVPPTSQSRQTILADLSIPLLGQNPSVRDLSEISQSSFSSSYGQPPMGSRTVGSHVIFENEKQIIRRDGDQDERERLKIEKGSWVDCIGWLEDDLKGLTKKILSQNKDLLKGIIFEIIHLSSTHPPSQETLYRSQLPIRMNIQ